MRSICAFFYIMLDNYYNFDSSSLMFLSFLRKNLLLFIIKISVFKILYIALMRLMFVIYNVFRTTQLRLSYFQDRGRTIDRIIANLMYRFFCQPDASITIFR